MNDASSIKRKRNDENRQSQAGTGLARRTKEDVRVIAITSGKGGVGKTNISANLAYSMSHAGKRVLVLDADMGLANLDVILGLTPKYNINHVLLGEKSLSEVIVTGPGNMKILPSASGIAALAELSRGQKLYLFNELNDLNEEFDFMLIDTAAGITANVMYFNMAAKEIIIVISPEPTSLTDAYALIKLLYQGHDEKRIMLLANMVSNAEEAMQVYQKVGRATEHFLGLKVEYLGYILRDDKVGDAVRRQKPFTEIYPQARASQCINAIAKKIYSDTNCIYNKGSIKFFSDAMFHKDR